MSSLAQLVEEATDDFLVAPDWEKNFLICSLIDSPQAGVEFAYALRRRLNQSEARIIGRSLDLLQVCMQNSYWTVIAIHHPEFQKFILEKARASRWQYEEQNKLLNLARSWGETYFPGHQHPGGAFPNYFKTYQYLVNLGCRFPGKNDDSNFQPPLPPQNPQQGSAPASPSAPAPSLAGEEGKVMGQLPEMIGNVQLLKEVLGAINPAEEDPRQNELVSELFNNATEYQKKIHEAIQRVAQEDALVQMLHYNDQLEDIQQLKNQLIERYENRASLPPQQAPNSPSSFRGIDSPIRLDLNLSSAASPSPVPHQSPFLPEEKPAAPASPAPANATDQDFDDFFAQRHQEPASPPQATSPVQPAGGMIDLLGLENVESAPFSPPQSQPVTDLFGSSSSTNSQSQTNPSYDAFKDLL